MDINNESIALSNKNKKWLRLFFEENMNFMEKNNLYIYDNLKAFADSYEAFLIKNNLNDNDILKLFLAELRFDQLAFKITSKCPKMKLKQGQLCLSKFNSTDTIDKWYNECNEIDKKINK